MGGPQHCEDPPIAYHDENERHSAKPREDHPCHLLCLGSVNVSDSPVMDLPYANDLLLSHIGYLAIGYLNLEYNADSRHDCDCEVKEEQD